MKMTCPHCGVKGSAQSSLMGKRVRCPKCRSIFDVTPAVLQPLPVEETELEQISSSALAEDAESAEDDVDDVFGRLLGDQPAAPAAEDGREGVDDDEEDTPVAALSSTPEEEPLPEQPRETEADDETLTVIEDPVAGAEPLEAPAGEEERLLLDEDEELVEAAPANKTTEYAQEPAGEDDERGILDFADELKESEDDVSLEIDGKSEDEQAALSDADRDAAETGAAEDEEVVEVELEEGEEAVIVQKCFACSEYVDPENKYEHDGNVYCSKCVPTELRRAMDDEEIAVAAQSAAASAAAAAEVEAEPGRFTISTLLKDAWHYSKGAKGSIWAALILMYLILIGMGVASTFYLVPMLPIEDPLQILLVEGGLQLLYTFLSFAFTAGIILIAINKIGQLPYSWKMVFSGFKRFGSLLLLFILQSVMLIIGFLLFILPGIYLSVGYILAIPLLLVKKLSPWQALEVSREAVHKRWWTVFFTLVIMGILAALSSIPLGLGLIWTVPMFFILVGVLYYHFFGADDV